TGCSAGAAARGTADSTAAAAATAGITAVADGHARLRPCPRVPGYSAHAQKRRRRRARIVTDVSRHVGRAGRPRGGGAGGADAAHLRKASLAREGDREAPEAGWRLRVR